MSKTMTELLNQVNEAAAAKAARIEEVKTRIATQRKIIEEAQIEATEAFDKVDTAAYHAAQEKLRSAQDTLHMLEKHLEKVKAEPGMSAEDYKALEKQIRAAFDSTYQETMEKAAEHVAAIADLYPEITDAFAAGNTALRTLQYTVQNDVYTVTRSDGQKVIVDNGAFNKHIHDYDYAGDIIKSLYDSLQTESQHKDWV